MASFARISACSVSVIASWRWRSSASASLSFFRVIHQSVVALTLIVKIEVVLEMLHRALMSLLLVWLGDAALGCDLFRTEARMNAGQGMRRSESKGPRRRTEVRVGFVHVLDHADQIVAPRLLDPGDANISKRRPTGHRFGFFNAFG